MEVSNSNVKITCGNLKGRWGCEAFDARFLEWVFPNGFVKLAIMHVGAINWCKWDQFLQVRGEICSMLLVSLFFVVAMLNGIQAAM